MDLPPELRLIHEPGRLRIMALLYRETDLGFTVVRDALGLSAGNLSSHAARLEEAGLVQSREALTRVGFERRFQITPLGVREFERYLAVLDGFVSHVRGDAGLAAPPVARASSSKRPSRAVLGAVGVGVVLLAAEAAQNALGDGSGPSYLGLGVAGALVAALAPLELLLRRVLGGAS